MKSCRVQFVVRNMGTKDKTLQINSVECKISDTTRITKKFGLPPQNAENHLISSVYLFFAISGRISNCSADTLR